MPLESVYPINLGMFFSSETVISTLESRIIGGVGIIEGVDIVIIIDNRGGGGCWTGVKKEWRRFLSTYMLN